MREQIEIKSLDFWFKVVDFLQQNWALVERDGSGVTVWFLSDFSIVFDEMSFPTLDQALKALKRNGFSRFAEDLDAQEFLVAPEAPFFRGSHPNGLIYSSGLYWK